MTARTARPGAAHGGGRGVRPSRAGGRALRLAAACATAVLLRAAPAAAQSPAAAPAPGTRAPGAARVTYVAGGSVYVDAGRLDGLAVGDTLEALRDGAPIARLRVAHLASHRAACDTLTAAGMPRAGDAVRFAPRPPAETPAPAGDSAGVAAPAAAPRPPRGPAPLRGRVGAHVLSVSSPAGDLTQPALDLRLDGAGLGGAHLDLAVDVRARRTQRAGARDDAARVYRLSTTIHDRAGRVRLTAGRQVSPQLASVSLFDGVLLEAAGARWSVGAFGGAQPEPVRMGLSSEVLEQGAFVGWRTLAGGARHASVTAGAVVSAASGNVDRTFGFAQAAYRDRRVSAWLAQEVDAHPAWKRALGDAAVEPTNTYATLRAEVTRGLSLHAGFDGRRSVRLWRDRETPETAFDDRVRRGAWAGASWEPRAALRLHADARASRVGGADDARSWTAGLETLRGLPAAARARARWSSHADDRTETRLVALGLSADPGGALHVELGGGARRTRDTASGRAEDATWVGADLDVVAGRRALINLSVEREDGLERTVQSWAGLSWRF
uniref:Uncharacterized protein n=1 Tax=Eiseniibacteriota bacterium TaxID=2212470 RepID=A0A832MKQ8_UNCEI